MLQTLPFKFFVILALVSLGVFQAAAQDGLEAEVKDLQQKIRPHLVKDEFAEIIPLAVKLAAAEKRRGPGNFQNYKLAIENLTNWRLKMADSDKFRWHYNVFLSEIGNAQKEYEELLKVAETLGDPLVLADVQDSYGSFFYRRGAFPGKTVLLFRNAFAIREAHLPPDSDKVLELVNKLAAITFAAGEFEEFITLNERYISAIEKKYGPGDSRLVPPLQLFANFLTTIGQDQEAEAVVQRLSQFKGHALHKRTPSRSAINRATTELDFTFGRPKMPMEPSSSMASAPNPTKMTRANSADTQTFRGNVVRRPGPPNTVQTGGDPGNVGGFGFYIVRTTVVIDEKGDVIEVLPGDVKKATAKKINDRLMRWKFKPLIYKGEPRKMTVAFSLYVYI